MNKKMIMLMSGRNSGEKHRRVGVEYEDWGTVNSDYPRSMHPDTMGYARSEYDEPESRSRGRRRYENGRYAPMSRMNDWNRSYPLYPDAPDMGYDTPEMSSRYYPDYPIYQNEGRERRMNPIGFAANMGGSDATMPHYNEMERMDGGGMSRGYSMSDRTPHFDRQMAEEWMENMENEDGTRGPHWTMEQAKQVMAQKGIDGSPLAFWVTLNSMYSDYCKVAKKLGVNTVEFYACMAEAFLKDKDAVGGGGPEKLAAYYNAVVEH